MFDRPDQRRDLRYATYLATLVFFSLLISYIPGQRLLAFWIAILPSLLVIFPATYLLLRLARILGRLTGLNKPVARARDNLRARIDEVVEELEEEIDEPR